MVNIPLVSIIIPTYNAEAYVRKAIESVINQSYQNLEIWLLDDASTDNSRAILEGIDDDRIRHFFVDTNTRKIGIVNEVIKKIEGKYLAFQDADDWSDYSRIEKQVNILENADQFGIVFTDYTISEHNSNVPVYSKSSWSSDQINTFFNDYGETKYNKSIACATMLVRSEIVKQIGGYNDYFIGKAGSDIFLVYNILKSVNATFIAEPLYHVMRSNNSFTEQLHSLKNIKSSYVWKVISELIRYDKQGVDLLNTENELGLIKVELQACETTLVELNAKKNSQIEQIRNSISYRIGNRIVRFLKFFKIN